MKGGIRETAHGNCNMTLGKDRRTHDLSLVILHEAWFQELVEERLSERFGRDDLKKRHLLKKFDIMNEGWEHKIAIYIAFRSTVTFIRATTATET
jgi:hypothetical protein